jgi:hypothetical protein
MVRHQTKEVKRKPLIRASVFIKSIGGDVRDLKLFFFKSLYNGCLSHFKVCFFKALVTY